ncbi:uncharacterized protein TEOVI_000199800 [Trypanosoma equiperdum]|uniref:Uncharacterized protein n=1 Tax=Trypanosoma equiperdum TaxID=5694 RepID=A0A1G4IEA2_TRYEQ|nr:hypothetical protein, conserved [Trypanosoma equiperdum]
MQELKSAILFTAAQNTDNSMRAQAMIPLAAARTRDSGLANRLATCLTNGSEPQRKLATLAGIYLGLSKLTNIETTAVDAGTAHTNGTANNHKVYETTTLKNFGDETYGNTFASAAKESETGIDINELKPIKKYKL